MTRALTPGEVKALLRQLIQAVGGLEAAAVYWTCSKQRASQLQNVNCPDMPTLAQVMCLEAVVGRPIVTGAAASAIHGESRAEVQTAAVEAVSRAAAALNLLHSMDADGRRDTAEIRAFQQASDDLAAASERLRVTAASLQPGEVG